MKSYLEMTTEERLNQAIETLERCVKKYKAWAVTTLVSWLLFLVAFFCFLVAFGFWDGFTFGILVVMIVMAPDYFKLLRGWWVQYKAAKKDLEDCLDQKKDLG